MLWDYPTLRLTEATQRILDQTLETYGGVLPLAHRWAGRTFCTPGGRLRLKSDSLRPSVLGGTGIDELWMCCTSPIVTGTVDRTTGMAPFREGEATVLTASGELVMLQDLIEASPNQTIGARHEAFARKEFGRPTWGIVSKKFDNMYPIPHHLHWAKWEVYDINRYDNGNVHPSHYFTTAMGLHSWVTRDRFLRCMEKFGSEEGNDIRSLSPHIKVPIDQGGFCMPNGVLHSPTNLVHHEVHVLMDEHFLAEDLTEDGRISPEVAFLACRERDYPREKHGDWDYLTSQINFSANQDPNFVVNNLRTPLRAEEFCSEGVRATWIVYGDLLGSQKVSILRLSLATGAKVSLNFDSPSVFHVNKGEGRVGKYDVRLHSELQLGTFAPEIGFIAQASLDSSGVEFENTGSEDFVLTLDFPQEAHLKTPGK